MSSRVLLLTPWRTPHKVISWQTAITLYYLDKVEILEETDDEIRSPSVTMNVPSVVMLKKPLDSVKRGVKFSRINVFTRDKFRCQYCGDRKGMRELNFDHVLPRDQGGRTVWENIVTSCYPCNDRKANKTPQQAGMTLLRKPFRPKTLPLSFLQLDRKTLPKTWEKFCNLQHVEEDSNGLFIMTGT